MKYITLFETAAAYDAAALDLPNVSLIEENMSVDYKPYVHETRLICKYNVTDTSNPTALRSSYTSDVFKSMEIDGVMLNEPVTEYTFDTVGEHTVKYELYDETKLDYNGLAYCDSLTSIVIPSSVTSIGEYTFNSCSGLTSIFIPSSVTNIGNGAFYRCSSLTSIVIPSSVTSIDEKTFNYCTGLTSIVIPNSVTSIGVSAFEGCSGLTSIVIPSSVTSIGDYAFYDCSSLISITIPDSVTSIGGSVFEGCSSLTSITVDSNNTVYDSRNNCNAIIETATNTLISGCKNTIIPDSVISIGDFAFSSCSDLTSIVIPSGVTNIGEATFQSCSGLTSIVIPSSVTSIGDYAFNSCSLTSIVSNATTAPTIQNRTFQSVNTGGTLTVPKGSTGYDTWMSTDAHYLGYNNWTKVEQ